MPKKKIKEKCILCEGDGCFDSCGEGFYIIGNKLYASCEGGCCGIEPIIIKYCPLCGKRLNKETDNDKENKVPKYQQDIAAAQAISGKAPTPIDRCEWWQRLAKTSTQEQIRAVLNTPLLPDITDEDASKTDKGENE